MPTLRQTAQAMRQGLDWSKQAGKETAWNLRTLPRGLQLLLSYQDNRWRLALRRTDVAPSEKEVELCARAFDVPAEPRRRNYTSSEKASVTNHKVVYHIVELSWREIDTGDGVQGAGVTSGIYPPSHALASPAQVESRRHLPSTSTGD
jgi:hypothetical protein